MIIVKYINDTLHEYSDFDEIEDKDQVITIDCSYNNIYSLNNDSKYVNLSYFDCSNNKMQEIISLPHTPSLQYFSCYNNLLLNIPDLFYINLKILNCSDNSLQYFPDKFNLPKLEYLYCMNNKISIISDTLCLPNLKIFNCSNNCLECLPKNFHTNFENLNILYCSFNKLKSLPDIVHNNIQEIHCDNNEMVKLCDHMNCPNLLLLNLSNNNINKLPDVMNVPEMSIFNFENNDIQILPLYIMEWHQLLNIYFEGNPIEMSPQILRFITRVINGNVRKLNVYNDQQNVHNSNIQQCVRDSINNITTRLDLPKFDSKSLVNRIIHHNYINQYDKQQLLEFINDKTEHSLLLLTFEEVLWYVFCTIDKDFEPKIQKEIYKIMHQELKDAECKCFTGRMNRIVNCLNGFSSLVKIEITDSEQIANIIYVVKKKISIDYSVEKHRTLVYNELKERGYSDKIINEWIEHIQDD